MPSTELRTNQSIETLIKDCVKEDLPNGDVLYISSSHSDFAYPDFGIHPEPFQAIFRATYLDDYQNLIKLLHLDNKRPFQQTFGGLGGLVTKENSGKWFNKRPVAVKRIWPAMLDMTGLEQFRAMRMLEEEDVLCATPLAATRWRFISKWVNGKLGHTVEEKLLNEYLGLLDKIASKLKDEGRWNKNWGVDRQPANYVVNDLSAENPLLRFTAIDPVFTRSDFIILG